MTPEPKMGAEMRKGESDWLEPGGHRPPWGVRHGSKCEDDMPLVAPHGGTDEEEMEETARGSRTFKRGETAGCCPSLRQGEEEATPCHQELPEVSHVARMYRVLYCARKG